MANKKELSYNGSEWVPSGVTLDTTIGKTFNGSEWIEAETKAAETKAAETKAAETKKEVKKGGKPE